MPVYVDDLNHYSGKGWWCHMAVETDGDLQELHAFAKKIGLKRAWFQEHIRIPHYDLVRSKRSLALEWGAIAVSNKEMFRKCAR